MAKHSKTHFELTPANAKRLNAYLELYNESPHRVTARYKISDVVNLALDGWLCSVAKDTRDSEAGEHG